MNKVSLTPELIKLLGTWEDAQATLAYAKTNETILRKEVIAAFFPQHKDEGTENFELNNDVKLKAQFKQTYSVSKNTEDVEVAIMELLKTGVDGEAACEGLVKFEPKMSTTKFKALTPSQHAIFDKVVEIKEATPSIEIVYPKVK